MKSEIIKHAPASVWEVLDAEMPLRMLSAEELRGAMGFPLAIVFGSPPCKDFAAQLPKVWERCDCSGHAFPISIKGNRG